MRRVRMSGIFRCRLPARIITSSSLGMHVPGLGMPIAERDDTGITLDTADRDAVEAPARALGLVLQPYFVIYDLGSCRMT
jgi:hypothetical protein